MNSQTALPSVPVPQVETTLELRQFIIDVREQAKKDYNVLEAERSQVVRLIIVVSDRTLIPKSRKAVISAILGYHVESTNDLSAHIVSVLADAIEGRRDGTDLLREVEKIIVDEPGIRAHELFNWTGECFNVSDMPAPDYSAPDHAPARSIDYTSTSTVLGQQDENHDEVQLRPSA